MSTMRRIVSAVALTAMLGACAGRDPHMTATVQPQDSTSDCAAILAQLTANDVQLKNLQREGDNTRGGNIALGVAGALLFWPVLFAMDFKDAAGKEAASIQQRQGYLQQIAVQKGCGGIPAAGQSGAPDAKPVS